MHECMGQIHDTPAEGSCQRCGTAVSLRFRKVFGGNDGTVYGCPECMTLSELCEGEAATPGQMADIRAE